MKKLLVWIFLSLALLLAIAYLPLPIPSSLDFQAMYHANLGVLRGIPLYDWDGQVGMIAEMAGVTPSQVILNPFAYPPWYSLLTLPLALLPIRVAARLWFAVNLLIVIVFAWLVTLGMPVRKRIMFTLLAILYLPILGTLFIGQFVFPVLLGTGLLIYALPRERVWLTSFGLFFLTFKPHMGGLIFLAVAVYLFLRRNKFMRRVFLHMSAILVFFSVASFFVDGAWPVHYLEKLLVFRGVSHCEGVCISIPMMILSMFDVSSSQALWVGMILLLGLSSWIIRSRPMVWKDADALIAAGFCITFLVSPYQYNYDFVVLLVPLFVLASRAQKRVDWAWLAFVYFLPWVGLFFGRRGNAILLVSPLVLIVLLWRHMRLLDSDPPDMYNQENLLREE